MAKTTPLYELHEQAQVVEYLELLQQQGKIVLFSAVPNNMWTKSWSQKLKAKKEGVRPGVPDMIVVTPKKLFFIEIMKTTTRIALPKPKHKKPFNKKEFVKQANDVRKILEEEKRTMTGAYDATTRAGKKGKR